MRAVLIISILILTACSDHNQTSTNTLSEEEQFEIINEALIPFIDSAKLEITFLNQFAVLKDTEYVSLLITQFENDGDSPIVFNSSGQEEIITYEVGEIDQARINGLDFINDVQLDSIRKVNRAIFNGTDSTSKRRDIYSISKPFRPCMSEMVAIQIYPIETIDWCSQPEFSYFLIGQINDRWEVRLFY